MADRIELGIVSRTFFYVPVWAAIEHGQFAAEGLDVTLSILGNASQVPPLTEGKLQVMIGSPEAAIQDAAAGGPLRLIAGSTGKVTHSVIAAARFKRIEDLKGATIGILNRVEGTFFQLQTIMSKHGLHFPDDYQVKETGGVPPRHMALLEGSIDAGLQSIPWNYAAEDAGLNNLGDVVDYVPDWQFNSTNVSVEWARANRGLLVRFLRALIAATEWVHSHRSEAAAIAERELPTQHDYALRAWDYYIGTNALTRDLSINRKGLQAVIAAQRHAGLLPATASTDINSYVAGEYLSAARGA
jgi:ABC-type nitrate/sulfonate/bicarbonate transport system substrate-binding protein